MLLLMMVQVRLELNETQDAKVRLVNARKNLGSKEKAVLLMIDEHEEERNGKERKDRKTNRV